ncbi:MAG: hypothetical protein PHQ32_03705 [Firmicutes bacterium]|nr:hypothetical protein [Bacillota bacterium]
MEVLKQLPKINIKDSETGCCPRFQPEIYNEKIFELEGLDMVIAKTRSFLYMPLNMGSVMTKTMKAIKEAGALVEDNYLILSKDVSMWRAEQYFLVSKPVKGLDNIKFSGSFITKVFEGGYNQIPKWIEEMKKYVKIHGYQMDDIYSFYTTCPKCAKVYGKNYVVLFADVKI